MNKYNLKKFRDSTLLIVAGKIRANKIYKLSGLLGIN